MTGPSDISRSLPTVPQRLKEPITDDMTAMVESMRASDPSSIKDAVDLGTPQVAAEAKDLAPQPQTAPAPEPAAAPAPQAPPAPAKRRLLVEMDTDPNLDMSDLEPVFVRSSDKGNAAVVSAPTVLNAFEETPLPDGQVTHWAPIAINSQLAQSGQLANYHGEMVPNDAAPIQTQGEYQKKLQESYDQGHKDALPPGMVPKVADSARGNKTQQLTNMGAQLIGEVGGQFATPSLAGIWKLLPLTAAGPLALVAGTVQTFGPNGHLKVLKDIQDQEGWLENYRDSEHKDKINLAVGPQGTLVPTAEEHDLKETLGNLKASETSTKVKLGGAGLLAGAGVTALVGGAALVATPVLATGAMLAPIAAGAVTQKRQLDNLRAQKAELLEAKAQGQTTTKVPVADANGNITMVDAPIDAQLEKVQKQIKMSALTLSISGTSAGIITAIACGAPVLMALGGLAIPAAIGVAMFPKETWEFISHLPEKAWHALQAVAHWAGEKISHIFHHDGKGQELAPADGSSPAAADDSPTVVKLRNTVDRFRELDPEQAEKLQKAAEILNNPPTRPEEMAAYQQATQDMNSALEALGKQDPEAVKSWNEGVQALNEERAQKQREALANTVEQFMAGPGQVVLQSTPVQESMKSLGVDEQTAAGLLSHMAAAQITGDSHLLNDLAAQANQGDAQAVKLVQLGQVLGQAYETLAAQQGQQAPAAA